MNVNEVTVGLRYRVSGDLAKGRFSDGTMRIIHGDVVQEIRRITETYVICQSGRKLIMFIINDNLKIEKF